MASEPDTTTERSHSTAASGTHASIRQQLRRRLQRSAEIAQPYIPLAAASLVAGLPLLWLVWSWVATRAWDSLALRLTIAAVCLPLTVYRHWPASWTGMLPAYWESALIIAVPWHSTVLLVANNYGTLWLLNTLAGATLLAVLQPPSMALMTVLAGSALGLLSVPILLHLQPGLARPNPLDIVTHVLVLAISAMLGLRLLQLARLRLPRPASGTQPFPGYTPGSTAASVAGAPANHSLLSELVNNSVLERLSTLEIEHGPVKARQMLNAQEQRFAAMMHADIRSFVRLVSSSNEAAMAQLVAQAFAELTSVGQDLSVIKPIGDGLFLYADSHPDRLPEEAVVDVLCLAVLFVAGIHNVNQEMAVPRGLPRLAVGVGLHAGSAVYGNLSGPHLVDLTVVGVNPNLTARLEELTKHPAIQLIIGTNALLLTEAFVALLCQTGLSLPGLKLLDLREIGTTVRDFPEIHQIWALDQQQTLNFAGHARQRLRASLLAMRARRVRPAVAEQNVHSESDLLDLLSTVSSLSEGGKGGEGEQALTLDSLMNDAAAAVVYVDKDWVARFCNDTMAANLGLTRDQVVGRTPFEYTPTDFKRSIFYAACARCLSEQRSFSQIGFSTVLNRWLVVNGFPIRGGGLMVAFEASQSAIKSQQLDALTAPDPLTGVGSKLALEQHMLALLAQQEPFALHLISLRRFRDINQAHGHTVGDFVLMQFASRLHSAPLDGQALFRLNGDEFAWVGPINTKTEYVSERLLEIAKAPVIVNGVSISLYIVAGRVEAPRDGDTCALLLQRAGIASGEAKRHSDSRLSFASFRPEMEGLASHRLSLEQELRQCLDGSQFELVLQPRVHLTTGHILAAEALIRWRHPKRGLLLPGEFLPLAAEVGIMKTIDAWVVRRAIELCKHLHAFNARCPLSCRLSADVLGDLLFIARIGRELSDAAVPARMLEIGFAEGDLMSDVQASLRTLQALADLGVRLSISHFGTGFPSSFSHLTKFPVRSIKVDRSFVADLHSRGPTSQFLRSIARMAHALRLSVIAEGVETDEQVDKLQRLHFDSAQGYALSAPMSLDEFLAFAAIRRISTDSRPSPLTL